MRNLVKAEATLTEDREGTPRSGSESGVESSVDSVSVAAVLAMERDLDLDLWRGLLVLERFLIPCLLSEDSLDVSGVLLLG